MNNHTSRPALGQVASIGTFYDARTDSFLPFSLLQSDNLPEVISRQDIHKSLVELSHDESFEEKFNKLGIGSELAASILSGLVNPGSFAHYLNNANVNSRILQSALHHTVTTVQEKLEFMNSDLKSCIKPSTVRTSEATHVVVEVEYGAQSVLVIERWLPSDVKQGQVELDFRKQAENFADCARKFQPYRGNESLGTTMPVDITVYSTTLGSDGLVMQDLVQASEYIEFMPLQIKNDNSGKGRPVLYRLLPIEILSFFGVVQVHNDSLPSSMSHECLHKFVELFDQFHICQQKLYHHQSYVSRNKLCLPRNYTKDVESRIQDLKNAEQNLKTKYARVLQDVRNGTSDSKKLWELLSNSSIGDMSPGILATLPDDQKEKVAFIDQMVSEGAIYIGYNGLNLNAQLAKRGDIDSYVLSFSERAMEDHASWKGNKEILLKLLAEPRGKKFIAILDCDAVGSNLEKAMVTHYQNGAEVVGNILEEHQYLAENSLAKCIPQRLETENIKKPLQRRFVKIPCPSRDCDQRTVCDWRCSECRALLEYGFSDQYIYCDCGRSLYGNYNFKCNASTHSPSFEPYDQTELLALLNSLDQSNYLNVLILGETGVGKSTFINAFVNYLYFQSLDEALDTEDLQWVIPCSFSTQTMDRTKINSEIVETKIKVGMREDEHDGSDGKSATQRTTVYPITIGTVTYRLIDTPGIGDTRGLEYDKKNMADILSTISGYDDLHGILILLKSNNARLTAHFSFCVKELLTHLHRSATNNVVFGFTNTRISNYMPGDTFGSLKTLLNERSDIGLSLSTQTTYCFDSESFRYLAAFKNKVPMENKSDFDGSWTKSRDEAWRMLNHFMSRTPHPIRSTVSLNGTRKVIIELTKPMADISQLIRTNISLCEDEVNQLKDARLSGDKLRTKLHPQKQLIKQKPLDKPRTVCGDKSCVEFKDDGTGTNKMLADYPNPCHLICYLEGVKIDVLAHPGLINCAAFRGQETCNKCGHHWQVHMHVLYELEMYTTTVKDIGIEKQLEVHATDLQLRQTAIQSRQALMEEWKDEHLQIQEAAAKFGLWMKDNSILPYNDATLAYLDVLIQAEQAKVDAGGKGNKEKLRDLHKDAEKHKELVEILTRSMKDQGKSQPINQREVNELIEHLYNLPHFGGNLESLKEAIAETHDRTNRELPHRVRARNTSRWNHVYTTSSPSQTSQTMISQRPADSSGSAYSGLHPMIVQNHTMKSGNMARRAPSIKRTSKSFTLSSFFKF